MEKIFKFERNVADIFRKNIVFIIINVLFSAAVFYMIMAHDLVNNYDGIWHLSNYVAGSGEISSGRGLLRYIDKGHFGIVSAPFQTLISLLIITIANAVLLFVFDIRNGISRYIISFILLANPVVCNTLTYGYTAIGYSTAYLMSVMALVSFRLTKKIYRIIPAAVFIAISMHCYQAYLGVTCIGLVILLICTAVNGDTKESLKHIRDSLLSVILGGAFYYCFLQLMLWYSKTELSSYNNVDSLSLGMMIKSLPKSVIVCYEQFFTFLFREKLSLYVSSATVFVIGLCIIAMINLIVLTVRAFKKNIFSGLMCILAMLLIPVGCNASLLLAVGASRSLIMSMGMMVFVTISSLCLSETTNVFTYVYKRANYILLALLLWASVLVVENDQVALKEGMHQTAVIANDIVREAIDMGYVTDGSYGVAILGRPADSPLFNRSEAFNRANIYARFGYLPLQPDNNIRTWGPVLSTLSGHRINYAYRDTYAAIQYSDEAKEMTVYPAEGSIKIIDNIITIKIGDPYQ